MLYTVYIAISRSKKDICISTQRLDKVIAIMQSRDSHHMRVPMLDTAALSHHSQKIPTLTLSSNKITLR